MKGGSEPDDFFKGLKGYFDKNYDFFKDNDWFYELAYHIEDNYNVNPYSESLLISLSTLIALTYVKLKRGQETPEVINDFFMERLNSESEIHFPLDHTISGGYLHRRIYVDFLFKLYEFSKKQLNTGIQYEIGLTGKKQLADSSFDEKSLRMANQRWYKRTLDDGQRVWRPSDFFDKDQIKSKAYASNKK